MKQNIFVSLVMSLFLLSAIAQEDGVDNDVREESIELLASTSPELTQDSVTTQIVNGKAVTTIKVVAPQSGSYKIRFWLMGVKHTDNSFSSYGIRIDNDSITAYIGTNNGDWRSCVPYNNYSVYLTQGVHYIHLEGTASDVPNVERIITINNDNNTLNPLWSDNTAYSYYKNHQNPPLSAYDPSDDSLSINYRELSYHAVELDSLYPPMKFNAELNKRVWYTFHRLEYYQQGQTVSVTTTTANGLEHVIHLFKLANPASNNWMCSSSNGQAQLSLHIPSTGFYYVLVRTVNPSEYGLCNLTINNDRIFENVPICCSRTDVSHTEYNTLYSCFAKSRQGDPEMLLMDNYDNILKYNDDYPYYASLSDYDWGKNARIDGTLNEYQWIFTTCKSYPSKIIPRYDIYVGCKKGSSIYTFPNYKTADIILSSETPQELLGSYIYNCISWSRGIWLSWVDPFSTIEEFDNFYNDYGFERTTNENTALIDVWKSNNIFTHASVKSKVHQYSSGYDWESKLGRNHRVFHPRYALESEGYGQVVAHYKKSSNPIIGPIIGPIMMGFSLNSEEADILGEAVSSVPDQLYHEFYMRYNDCLEDEEMAFLGNTRNFENVGTYRKLLEFCCANPQARFLLYKEVLSRCVIPIKVLKDITKMENEQMLKDVEEQCARMCMEKYHISTPDEQSKGLLLVKAMLANATKGEELSEMAEKDVTYSNDPTMEISAQGKEICISFRLEADAAVSVFISPADGFSVQPIIQNKECKAGENIIYHTVPRYGIYSVSAIVNGCVYEKKVSVY